VRDRDRPIDRNQPNAGSESHNERIARLEAKGLVGRPTATLPDDFFTVERPRSPRSVVEALLEEREEGR
jgi:hypothetical protein